MLCLYLWFKLNSFKSPINHNSFHLHHPSVNQALFLRHRHQGDTLQEVCLASLEGWLKQQKSIKVLLCRLKIWIIMKANKTLVALYQEDSMNRWDLVKATFQISMQLAVRLLIIKNSCRGEKSQLEKIVQQPEIWSNLSLHVEPAKMKTRMGLFYRTF